MIIENTYCVNLHPELYESLAHLFLLASCLIFMLIFLIAIFYIDAWNVFIYIEYSSETIKRCLPNLHSLGEIFLPYFLPQLSTLTIIFELYVFNLCKYIHDIYSFISIVFLTSYTLAGSQAFAILLDVQ